MKLCCGITPQWFTMLDVRIKSCRLVNIMPQWFCRFGLDAKNSLCTLDEQIARFESSRKDQTNPETREDAPHGHKKVKAVTNLRARCPRIRAPK